MEEEGTYWESDVKNSLQGWRMYRWMKLDDKSYRARLLLESYCYCESENTRSSLYPQTGLRGEASASVLVTE